MRIFLALIVLAMTAPALAQPEKLAQEVIPDHEIFLTVGQVRVFRFDEQIGSVNLLTKGPAEATAQSDRQISVLGSEAGETQLYVFGQDGKRIYSAIINVSAERGHLVRMYGTGKNDDVNAGYVAVYCHDTGCGRQDKDLPAPSVSVQRVSRGAKDARAGQP